MTKSNKIEKIICCVMCPLTHLRTENSEQILNITENSEQILNIIFLLKSIYFISFSLDFN